MSLAHVGDHPSEAVVSRFLRGAATAAEARHLVRHLVAGCVECRQAVGSDWLRNGPASPADRAPAVARTLPPNVLPFTRPKETGVVDYGGAFERASEAAVEGERRLVEERRELPALIARLEAMSPAERREAVRTEEPLQRWAVVVSLLDDSRTESVSRPERALELADLAVAAAVRLDQARYPARLIADLTGRAWAGRGNVLRILGRFPEAQESFERAHELLERGTGDPTERCRLLMMTATLHARQGRLEEADGLLDKALRMAVRCGDRHLQGGALVRMSRIAQRREQTDRALDLLARALTLIDPDEDARLLLTARHNHVLLMVESGRYREALDRMEETRALHLRVGGRLDLLRFRWLEGRTYAGLGWSRQAAGYYEDVRRDFITAGLALDAALVSLDLAAVYAQEGRTTEVRTLAEEMLPIFRSREAHQEAMAALLVFHDAARRQVATVGLIQKVAEELRRWRREPELQLRPPEGSG